MMRSLSCVSALVLALCLLHMSCSKRYLPAEGLSSLPQHSLQQVSFCNGAASQQALYRCLVNGKFLFKKLHLSGLLLLKYDSANRDARAVFTNELGYTFFDFNFRCPDSFSVNRILPQFDKPYMIRALRQDIQLLLGMVQAPYSLRSGTGKMLVQARSMGDSVFYFLEPKTGKILRSEVLHRQLKTRLQTTPYMTPGIFPDSFAVAHLKTNFRIEAKRIVHEE